MAAKDDRITFRTGDVRLFKIAQYKNKYEKLHGRKLTNTEIMLEALDMFLKHEDEGPNNKIRKYEDAIIKIMLGFNRNSVRNDNEYLDKLSSVIEEFKNILNDC